jgi:hypothetical protein
MFRAEGIWGRLGRFSMNLRAPELSMFYCAMDCSVIDAASLHRRIKNIIASAVIPRAAPPHVTCDPDERVRDVAATLDSADYAGINDLQGPGVSTDLTRTALFQLHKAFLQDEGEPNYAALWGAFEDRLQSDLKTLQTTLETERAPRNDVRRARLVGIDVEREGGDMFKTEVAWYVHYPDFMTEYNNSTHVPAHR